MKAGPRDAQGRGPDATAPVHALTLLHWAGGPKARLRRSEDVGREALPRPYATSRYPMPHARKPFRSNHLCPPAPSSLCPRLRPQISDACAAWRRPPAAHTPTTAAPSSSGADPSAAAAPRTPALPSTHSETLALSPHPFWLLSSPDPAFATDVQCHPLSAWGKLTQPPAQGGSGGQQQPQEQQQQQAESHGGSVRHVLLAFSDPSNLPEYPGWPLRNALLMAAARWGVAELRVGARDAVVGRVDVVGVANGRKQESSRREGLRPAAWPHCGARHAISPVGWHSVLYTHGCIQAAAWGLWLEPLLGA